MKQAVIDTGYAMGGSYFETLEWCASEVATDRQIGEKEFDIVFARYWFESGLSYRAVMIYTHAAICQITAGWQSPEGEPHIEGWKLLDLDVASRKIVYELEKRLGRLGLSLAEHCKNVLSSPKELPYELVCGIDGLPEDMSAYEPPQNLRRGTMGACYYIFSFIGG